MLEHQSHTAGNEAIAEEDEGTETSASAAAASALSEEQKTVTRHADSDAVFN